MGPMDTQNSYLHDIVLVLYPLPQDPSLDQRKTLTWEGSLCTQFNTSLAWGHGSSIILRVWGWFPHSLSYSYHHAGACKCGTGCRPIKYCKQLPWGSCATGILSSASLFRVSGKYLLRHLPKLSRDQWELPKVLICLALSCFTLECKRFWYLLPLPQWACSPSRTGHLGPIEPIYTLVVGMWEQISSSFWVFFNHVSIMHGSRAMAWFLTSWSNSCHTTANNISH